MLQTPKNLGFIMPAEWEKHSAVWLAWPHDQITFPKGHMEKVESRYVEIIKALSESEDVELLVLNDLLHQRTSTLLQEGGVNMRKVTFHITDYADVWLRDYGPIFLSNPQSHEQAWVKFTYNAYSNKFPALLKDNQVFFNLRGKVDKRMFQADMVLEGGSIEQNGKGSILTTEQCLLNSGRNENLNRTQIEDDLKSFLGASNIVWLKQGLLNDHTDGHIDDIAKFTSADTILCAYEDDEAEENFPILKKNFEDLQKATDQNGKPFNLIKLPMPHLRYDDNKPFEAGNKAPVSYTNFYIGNTVVLIPSYKDPNDAKALAIIQSCFPNKKIVPIDCTDIAYGGGAIHCMTQQQPLT